MSKWILSLLLPFSLISQDKFTSFNQKIKGSDITFKMISVPGGKYTLGSAASDKDAEVDETPAKTVEISDFWMAETEVTYDLFQLFLDETKDPGPHVDGITRPSKPYIDFTLGMGKVGNFPANSMQQYSALMFCKWLYKKTGVFYRLPTEAEWEYTAKKSYDPATLSNALILGEFEWFADNSDNKYHKVASKKPNKLGFYDLLGNVAEWTMDEYESNYYEKISKGTKDPITQKTKRYPVTVRGGNYKSKVTDLRLTNRTKSESVWNRRDPQIPKSKWWNADAPFIGFRLVVPRKSLKPEEVETFFESVLK
ncbi:MAG: SUMF1/EgtB/PvdO family nonheme iron enzyme [Saprospiraceae bacterium]|jgi:formylglycine-generating enzyme required for sulfatase activity|nr:SUMF1/EgtB/PvdO family nonheme iron enzyme [Saprospiraceae bacterium]MBP6446985.1 SUMF1/EgtB/PvdO family nonheme iron enzyme [Saprospiraceae bacterium]